MSTQRRFRGITILLIVAAVVLISLVAGNLRRAGDISYGEMRSCFVQEKVRSFTATDDRLTAVLQDDSTVTCALQSFDTFYSDLNDLVVEQSDKGIITSDNYPPSNSTNWLSTLLPYVLAFNSRSPVCRQRFVSIAGAMGLPANLGEAHAAETVIQFVKQLSGSVGIPATLAQLNKVDPADFGTLADLALRDTCMTTNQRTPTRQEVIAVYTAAFRG